MKLVRDNIINIIFENGKSCKYHFAEREEYEQRIFDKMQEELSEFTEEPSLEEAADVYEVFLSILDQWQFDLEDVQKTADEKRKERGAFALGIVLEEVTKS